ncbi:DUF1207 domain-containing protein [Blastopirellula marina]|uniref:DUF1207 domain-containing protein n=1 Tax=Blastopirellula marina DSM 3645 TaxID=314230 RepID=A3ZXW3_9BACT|nr:DUF1207 domain-containing protein [Blastopirellula marina]EAQ78672.1 hypothetical protein DSM3645_07765 [Blastopirellula marina DSM 3645]
MNFGTGDRTNLRYAVCVAVGMIAWLLFGIGSALAQYPEAYQRDLDTLIPGDEYTGPRPTFAISHLEAGNQEALPFPDRPIEVSEYELNNQPWYDASGDYDDWQVLPTGHIYKAHLANVKESRMAVKIVDLTGDTTILDGNLGGRFGVFRYGNHDPYMPQGIQWDVEGSAHVRLDIPEEVDVRAVDFRAGNQLTWSYDQAPNHRSRFGYYHLSSHLGDEFLIKNPGYNRLNYSRDVLIFGHSIYLREKIRIYGQIGWAFYTTSLSKPWELDFGFEWSPIYATGPWGEPFFAIDGHLREDVNWGGTVTVQTGWAWVGDDSGHLLRIGLQYLNGASSQYSFTGYSEQQIGFGIWYDY